eukprot:COSAG01_NODE_51207_length_356_cov_2.143969_2_plen_34_part_01
MPLWSGCALSVCLLPSSSSRVPDERAVNLSRLLP